MKPEASRNLSPLDSFIPNPDTDTPIEITPLENLEKLRMGFDPEKLQEYIQNNADPRLTFNLLCLDTMARTAHSHFNNPQPTVESLQHTTHTIQRLYQIYLAHDQSTMTSTDTIFATLQIHQIRDLLIETQAPSRNQISYIPLPESTDYEFYREKFGDIWHDINNINAIAITAIGLLDNPNLPPAYKTKCLNIINGFNLKLAETLPLLHLDESDITPFWAGQLRRIANDTVVEAIAKAHKESPDDTPPSFKRCNIHIDTKALAGIALMWTPADAKSTLLNLLSNTLRYAGHNPTANIQVTTSPETGAVSISYWDNGPGWPQHTIAQGSTTYGDSNTENPHSTGRGIAGITTRLTNRGFTVSLSNHPDTGGAAFSVEIPTAAILTPQHLAKPHAELALMRACATGIAAITHPTLETTAGIHAIIQSLLDTYHLMANSNVILANNQPTRARLLELIMSGSIPSPVTKAIGEHLSISNNPHNQESTKTWDLIIHKLHQPLALLQAIKDELFPHQNTLTLGQSALHSLHIMSASVREWLTGEYFPTEQPLDDIFNLVRSAIQMRLFLKKINIPTPDIDSQIPADSQIITSLWQVYLFFENIGKRIASQSDSSILPTIELSPIIADSSAGISVSISPALKNLPPDSEEMQLPDHHLTITTSEQCTIIKLMFAASLLETSADNTTS